MEMAFMKQGGIRDDGMTKDPVSGNDIPPGSMAKEVRDNIPAMLSEGEYVVPADVLRYYGVNFFENLRGQAKNGLRKMEQNGRIGGTPMTQQDIARNMQQPVMASAGAMLEPEEREEAPRAMGNRTPGFAQPVQAFNQGTTNAGGSPMAKDFTSSYDVATARMNTPMFSGTSSQQANIAAAQQNQSNQEVTTLVTHYDKDGNQMQIKYVSVGGAEPQPAKGQDEILKQYKYTEVQYAEYKKTQKQGSGIDKQPNPFEMGKVDNIGPLVDIGAKDAIGIKEWAAGHLKETDLQEITKQFGPAIQSLGFGQQARRIAEVRAMAKYRESLGGQANIDLAEQLNAQAEALINNPGLRALEALGLMSGNQIYKDMLEYTPGDSLRSLPNASNGQTVPYMFTDDNGNPLTASNYQFAEALAGTYGWEARHFAVQQQASMMLNDKGIEDNTYFGGGTQSNDITEDDNPSGGGSSNSAEAARLAAVQRQAAIEKANQTLASGYGGPPGGEPTISTNAVGSTEEEGAETTSGTIFNEGGLMTTPKPKKKKRGRPKKSGLAGKK